MTSSFATLLPDTSCVWSQLTPSRCVCVREGEGESEGEREGGREISRLSPQNWVVEFDKWLPDREQEEQRKRAGPLAAASSKHSRARNKRSQQNGRSTRMLLQLPPCGSSLFSAPINGIPATKDAVSTPTTVSGDNQLFVGGGALSESDQQLLLSLASSADPLLSQSLSPGNTFGPTQTTPTGSHAQTTPTNSGAIIYIAPFRSLPHSPLPPNSGVANSRSHTASPSVPEVQYRSFRLSVLSETHRNMESRLRLIKLWKEEGEPGERVNRGRARVC